MYRYLILFFLISIGLSSCATKTVEGFAKTQTAQDVYSVPYFSDSATDYVYKAHISIYGKEFGGIFITKKISDTTHRVAFTTEFGNKLFDFSISGNEFTVNYILEELDRKIIVNTLKRDFMLLLKNDHPVDEHYENEQFEVYKSKSDGRYNYLFADRESGQLFKLVHATKAKEKIIFTYTAPGDKLAEKITIEHKNINLKIDLNYISQ